LLRFVQIRPCKVVKVAIMEQNTSSLVINIQKRLEVRKLVGSPDFRRRAKRKVNLVSGRKLKHQLRLKCALNVQVQLGLRHAFGKFLHRPSFQKEYAHSQEHS